MSEIILNLCGNKKLSRRVSFLFDLPAKGDSKISCKY